MDFEVLDLDVRKKIRNLSVVDGFRGSPMWVARMFKLVLQGFLSMVGWTRSFTGCVMVSYRSSFYFFVISFYGTLQHLIRGTTSIEAMASRRADYKKRSLILKAHYVAHHLTKTSFDCTFHSYWRSLAAKILTVKKNCMHKQPALFLSNFKGALSSDGSYCALYFDR